MANPSFISCVTPEALLPLMLLTSSIILLSAGFYSVSGSSLSDSCYSVSSEAAPGGSVKVSCRPRSLDHSATHWREAESHTTECPEGTVEKQERRPFSTGMTCNLKKTHVWIIFHSKHKIKKNLKTHFPIYISNNC